MVLTANSNLSLSVTNVACCSQNWPWLVLVVMLLLTMFAYLLPVAGSTDQRNQAETLMALVLLRPRSTAPTVTPCLVCAPPKMP